MEIGIVLVVAAIVLFIFLSNGFKTRCPQCGAFSRHPKDEMATQKHNQNFDLMREVGLLDRLEGTSIAKQAEKGFHHDKLRCFACGHIFDRSIAIQWHSIARKVGEKKALAEYNSIA